MVKQFSKFVLVTIALASILCSSRLDAGVWLQNEELLSVLSDSHHSPQQEDELVSKTTISNPFSLPVSLFIGEEWEPEEENTGKKHRRIIGNYNNGEKSIHLANAPCFGNLDTNKTHLYNSSLYLLFEVFRI